ncbi:uncharacterized protein LOC106056309 isoform X1 [Biomphalaria glabrata]|uniref:Uncharacterized protein LOC106056309 isoform X1 n=1 Tax=Biomphalaria glabrata TaxID=6526 RepID=A0A9W2Z8C9_BIOGL|nr:uncharacterized protein LOC106056309 isoform X1 [Biomphalaria glabrata]XP_055871356.1 uncharacterized protein LOC106056309 isoform X1 [Biomphalaria glabrata]
MHCFSVLTTLKVILLFASEGSTYVLENCGWEFVNDASLVSFILTSPAGKLSHNLICSTAVVVKRKENENNNLLLRVNTLRFNLSGPGTCIPHSERLTFSFRNEKDKDIVWCGKSYSEELFFPGESSFVEVLIEYKTGMYGLGTGFSLQFSKVGSQFNSNQELKVLPTPKLLYSPFYPFASNYFPSRYNINLQAPEDYFVHISSTEMNLNSLEDCGLEIDGVTYCGNKKFDIIVKSSTVSVKFLNQYRDKQTFVLMYSTISQEMLGCLNQTTTLNVTEQEKILQLNLLYSLSVNCMLQFNTSREKVIQFKFSLCNNFIIYDNGTVVNVSNIQYYRSHSHLVSVAVYSPTSLTALGLPCNLSVQAVDNDWLASIHLSEYSLLWITTELMNNQGAFQIESDEAIGIKILNSASQPEPVSKYLILSNGPDSSYFELTKDCNGNLLSNTEIFSLRSSVVTAEFRASQLSEFQILMYPQGFVNVNTPTTPLFGNFSFNLSRQNTGNLHCHWEIPKSNAYISVKFQTKNQFQKYFNNQMLISEGSQENVIALFDQAFSENAWLFAQQKLLVDVRIDNYVGETSPFGFNYTYSDVSGLYNNCFNKYVYTTTSRQTVATPNFPDFYYRLIKCRWIISKSSSQLGSQMYIDFPKLLYEMCRDKASLIMSTNSFDGIDLCLKTPSYSRIYNDQTVYVDFTAKNFSYPGFEFAFYHKEPESVRCGQSNLYVDKVYSLVYSGSSTSVRDCIFVLASQSSFSVITLVLNERLYSINTVAIFGKDEEEDTWTKLLQLDSNSILKEKYRFQRKLLQIVVSWDYLYKPFQMYAYMNFSLFNPDEILSTTSSPLTSDQTSDSQLPIFVGTFVACVIIAALLIAGIIYCYRKKKLERARHERESSVNFNRRTSAIFIFNPVIINNAPPPPYPGLSNIYSEVASVDEGTELELPPPYTRVARGPNTNTPVAQDSGGYLNPVASVYDDIDTPDSNMASNAEVHPPAYTPEENRIATAPPAYTPPSQSRTANAQLNAARSGNVSRHQRAHVRGNNSLGEL